MNEQKTPVEHTAMIGRRVRFISEFVWEGLPRDYPSIRDMVGTVVSVYQDRTCPRNPVYTVKMGDGRLIEAHGGHIADVDPAMVS